MKQNLKNLKIFFPSFEIITNTVSLSITPTIPILQHDPVSKTSIVSQDGGILFKFTKFQDSKYQRDNIQYFQLYQKNIQDFLKINPKNQFQETYQYTKKEQNESKKLILEKNNNQISLIFQQAEDLRIVQSSIIKFEILQELIMNIQPSILGLNQSYLYNESNF